VKCSTQQIFTLARHIYHPSYSGGRDWVLFESNLGKKKDPKSTNKPGVVTTVPATQEAQV
jgi:hypothetical protein